VDGKHLLWRASDSHRELTAKVGGVEVPTGGMYGFLGILMRVHARYGGDVQITWESPPDDVAHELYQEGVSTKNFRFDLYPEYKSKHEELPEEQQEFLAEMAEQERRLQTILYHLGVPQFAGIGCEGDDVAGTLARQASEMGREVIIYSGDSDIRQLCQYPGVRVATPPHVAKSEARVSDAIYDAAAVEAKHGVPPESLATLKALVGGKDNLPGVKGVGKKYGPILVRQYGTLARVIRAARDSDDAWPLSERVRQAVVESSLDLIRFYKVAKIDCDSRLYAFNCRRDQSEVVKQFKQYRFQSLLSPLELRSLMALGQRQSLDD
jgi:DNA polymerase-1